MVCESGCFEMNVTGCDSVLIPVSLAPLASYIVRLIRPGSSIYFTKEITTDANGRIVLAGFTWGIFNRGELFKMTITNDSGEPVMMLFGSDTYSCILLNIKELV